MRVLEKNKTKGSVSVGENYLVTWQYKVGSKFIVVWSIVVPSKKLV